AWHDEGVFQLSCRQAQAEKYARLGLCCRGVRSTIGDPAWCEANDETQRMWCGIILPGVDTGMVPYKGEQGPAVSIFIPHGLVRDRGTRRRAREARLQGRVLGPA